LTLPNLYRPALKDLYWDLRHTLTAREQGRPGNLRVRLADACRRLDATVGTMTAADALRADLPDMRGDLGRVLAALERGSMPVNAWSRVKHGCRHLEWALWPEFEYAGSRELMTAEAVAYAEAQRRKS
jgi:hypothetical protein